MIPRASSVEQVVRHGSRGQTTGGVCVSHRETRFHDILDDSLNTIPLSEFLGDPARRLGGDNASSCCQMATTHALLITDRHATAIHETTLRTEVMVSLVSAATSESSLAQSLR